MTKYVLAAVLALAFAAPAAFANTHEKAAAPAVAAPATTDEAAKTEAEKKADEAKAEAEKKADEAAAPAPAAK